MSEEVRHNSETQDLSTTVPKTFHLFRRNGNPIWYYRQRIPTELVKAGIYGKKKEIKSSLQTPDQGVASRLAETKAIELRNEWDEKRREIARRANDGSAYKQKLSELSKIQIRDIFIRYFIDIEKHAESGTERNPLLIPDDELQARIADVGEEYTRTKYPPEVDGVEFSCKGYLESIDIETDDNDLLLFAADFYSRARAEVLRRTVERLQKGDRAQGDPLFGDLNSDSLAGGAASKHGFYTSGIKTVKDLCADFRERKEKKGVSKSTLLSYNTVFGVLVDYFEKMPIVEIGIKEAKAFVDFLSTIPLNSKKHYPALSLRDAAKVDMESKRVGTISPKTQKQHYEACVGIFRHAVENDAMSSNPFEGQMIRERLPEVETPKKKMLSSSDLTRILNSKSFKGWRSKAPEKFWAPLLCLFHGCRANEACQLLCEDIKNEDGIFYFWIRVTNDAGDKIKRLKNLSSERKIPIHEELIKMGFLDYVDEVRQKGGECIFPRLKYNQKDSKADSVSKTFNALVKKELAEQNLGRGDKRMHSMRHSVVQILRDKGVAEDRRVAIGGWGKEKSKNSEADYGDGFSLSVLKREIDKVEFEGVDFSHLYPEN